MTEGGQDKRGGAAADEGGQAAGSKASAGTQKDGSGRD